VWASGSLIPALSLGVPAVAAALPLHEELPGGGKAGCSSSRATWSRCGMSCRRRRPIRPSP
jgi:hypothetical protein